MSGRVGKKWLGGVVIQAGAGIQAARIADTAAAVTDLMSNLLNACCFVDWAIYLERRQPGGLLPAFGFAVSCKAWRDNECAFGQFVESG